jgi:hypothetical protein
VPARTAGSPTAPRPGSRRRMRRWTAAGRPSEPAAVANTGAVFGSACQRRRATQTAADKRARAHRRVVRLGGVRARRRGGADAARRPLPLVNTCRVAHARETRPDAARRAATARRTRSSRSRRSETADGDQQASRKAPRNEVRPSRARAAATQRSLLAACAPPPRRTRRAAAAAKPCESAPEMKPLAHELRVWVGTFNLGNAPVRLDSATAQQHAGAARRRSPRANAASAQCGAAILTTRHPVCAARPSVRGPLRGARPRL